MTDAAKTYRNAVRALEALAAAELMPQRARGDGEVDGHWQAALDHYQAALAGYDDAHHKARKRSGRRRSKKGVGPTNPDDDRGPYAE